MISALLSKTKRLVSALLIFISLPSCVEEFDFSYAFQRQLVLNCLLENSPKQSLSLSYNMRLGSNKEKEIPESVAVKLYKDSEFVGEFLHEQEDVWTLDYTPVSGAEYRIEVCDLSGKILLSATTEMPVEKPLVFGDYWNPREPVVYGRQTHPAGPVWIYVLCSDNGKLLVSPEIGTTHPYVDDFNSNGEIEYQKWQFGTSDHHSIVSVAGTCSLHYSYIRIRQTRDDAYTSGDNEAFFLYAKETGDWIVELSVSESYDRYLQSSFQKMKDVSKDDIVSRLQEDIVYSNISGGLGIFGAVAKTVFEVLNMYG